MTDNITTDTIDTTDTNNANKFNGLQERNQQVLSNISQLQKQEKELYNSLDDVRLSKDEKQQIIQKINEISQMRMNLYAGLKDMYSYYHKNASSSKDALQQSMVAIDILEDELNESKSRLNLIEEQRHNKLRLVQINNYYGKRYNAYSNLMKTIVVICIPIVILAALSNAGILPSNIYKLLASIILIVGAVIIGLQIIDLSNRSSMNWDEYNWHFDKDNVVTETTEDTESEHKDPWETPGSKKSVCVGSACCYEGSTFDEEKNICVINTTETFKEMGKYSNLPIKYYSANENVSPMDASFSKF
jgi:hypothetical protein